MLICEVSKMDRINAPKKNRFGYYEIWYEIKGKWNKISTKTKSYPEAVKFFADFEKKFRERRKGNLFETDFEFAAEKALNAKKNSKPKTIINYRDTITKLKKFIQTWDKKENPDLFNAFLMSMFGKYAPVSINKAQQHITELLRIAKRQGSVPESYTFERVVVKIPKKIPLNITPEDFNKLYFNSSEDFKKLLLFDYNTGLRIGNVCDLKWENINLEKGEMRLTQVKTGNDIYVPMLDVALNMLKEMYPKRTSDYVFLNNGKKWGVKSAISRMVYYCRKTFGTNKYHFHTLRYTFAQKLLGAQIPLEFVKEFLGHESIESTVRYVSLMDALKKQIEKINSLVPVETSETKDEKITNSSSFSWN